MLRQPFDMEVVNSPIHRGLDPVDIYTDKLVIDSDGKVLWFFVVERLHPEAALNQLHTAVDSDGTGAGSLVGCNVVSAVLGL